jgi:hypothetical protein
MDSVSVHGDGYKPSLTRANTETSHSMQIGPGGSYAL